MTTVVYSSQNENMKKQFQAFIKTTVRMGSNTITFNVEIMFSISKKKNPKNHCLYVNCHSIV